MKRFFFILLTLAVFASCERKIDEFKPDANGVNFSKFVAVGNSMTAGFADGALYTSGQVYSIPNIMATQFKTVGGGEFKQPLIGTEDGVGFQQIPGGLYFFTKRVLKVVQDHDCSGPISTYSLKPAFAIDNPDQQQMKAQLFAPPTVAGPYNNMGVPGITLQAALFPGYAAYNPYFARFANTTGLSSVIGEAMAQQPTFFMMWLGDNDALGSALAGTDALLTPIDTFAIYYPMAVGAMMNSGNNPKGVVATIPDVTSLPYFTTISKQLPYNGVTLDSAQAAGLNILYTMYGHPEIQWQKGQNPFVYLKNDGSWAQMGPDDLFLITLPTDSIQCRGMGIADPTTLPIPKPYPIPSQFVLNKEEQDNIKARINAFNQIITQVAIANDLAIADMNTYMKNFVSGMVFDGIKMNTTFITGGMFSTDGIHLNPRGSVVAANYLIQAINNKYGCNIPQANVTSYPGLKFP